MISTDTPQSYYNFTHPHNAVPAGAFVHRLGRFQTPGSGLRPRQPMPRVGVLHVPVADFFKGGGDPTAEICAQYLSAPPENLDPAKYGGFLRKGCTHATCDRDSYILCLPMDSICWGCGNQNTGADSWEIEIAGWGTENAEYWKGSDAKLKLIQAAKAHIASAKLVAGDQWRYWIVPARKAKLAADGTCIEPGWTQHREIPYWDELFDPQTQRSLGRGRVLPKPGWAQPPTDNILAQQHTDICENFPYDVWFEILNAELKAA